MRVYGILLAAILAAATIGFAAEGFDPAQRAKTIAPFLDEQTFLVAHVDLQRVDVEALWERITRMLGDAAQRNEEFNGPKNEVKAFLDGMIKAGAREIYVVVSMADTPPEMPLVVVPRHSGADEQAIRSLLLTGKAGDPASAPTSAPNRETFILHNAVVLCGPSTVERLKALTPSQCPELAKAFAAAGDTAGQLLLLPTEDNRRVIEETMPELPEFLGGGPSTILTQGFLWGAVGADFPPKMRLQAVVESKDPESAAAFQALIPKFVLFLLTQGIGREKPDADIQASFERLMKPLTPQTEGNRLTLVLDDGQLGDILDNLLGPPLRQARKSARLVISMTNMRAIVTAIHMFEDQKKQWPDSLQALVEGDKYILKQMLKNPRLPGREVGYMYIKPAQPMNKVDPQQLILYEAHDEFGEGVNCAFVDGHVEFVTDSNRFKALLHAAQGEKPAETQPANPK